MDPVNGVFRLSNTTEPNAVRYRWISPVAGTPAGNFDRTDGPVTVDVHLGGRQSSTTAGGIIYRLNRASHQYYAFLVSPEGGYSLVMRGPNGGLSPKFTGNSPMIHNNDWNTLGIVGHGDALDLYVNHSKVHSVDASELHAGDTGVVAAGVGVFEFDNVRLWA
jgi:hypothetical protein